jgi:hypothetical protein
MGLERETGLEPATFCLGTRVPGAGLVHLASTTNAYAAVGLFPGVSDRRIVGALGAIAAMSAWARRSGPLAWLPRWPSWLGTPRSGYSVPNRPACSPAWCRSPLSSCRRRQRGTSLQ